MSFQSSLHKHSGNALKRSLWGLWSLLASSCHENIERVIAPPTHPVERSVVIYTPVWLDATFTTNQRQSIEGALAAWNDALGGYQQFIIATEDMYVPAGGYISASRASLGWGLTIEYVDPVPESVNPNILAWLWRGSTIQFFPRHIDKGISWRKVAEHEIGHYLGLDDNEKGSLLMHTPYSNAQCIDLGTIHIIARRRAWDETKMTPECEELRELRKK